MAASNIQTTVAGKKLMLFDNSGHSFAFATNHTLSINGETSDISTKDHGIYGSSMVNRITWEITSENVFPLDASGDDSEFNDLFTHMTSRDEVTVYFGIKVETGSTYSGSTSGDGLKQGKGNIDADYWEASGNFLYKGKVIITSLQLNAPDGEEASYSATFTGIGSLVKVTSVG